jgi:DNA-binding MarR family transcriptional regulator
MEDYNLGKLTDMETRVKTDAASNADNVDRLWLLLGKIHHKRMLVRQRELSPYNIPTRQLRMLSIIQDLGTKATLSAIAEKVERKVSVISQQTQNMEKYGLIKRFKETPRSRLLKIELTPKGLSLTKIDRKSKAMEDIMSVLNTEERNQLHLLLDRLLQKLNEYSEE